MSLILTKGFGSSGTGGGSIAFEVALEEPDTIAIEHTSEFEVEVMETDIIIREDTEPEVVVIDPNLDVEIE